MRPLLLVLALYCAFLLGAATPASGEMTVLYPRPQSNTDIRYDYHSELLKEALRRTEDEFGPARARPAPMVMNEIRMVRLLEEGSDKIDVLYKPTSSTMELTLNPVRIPLDKGLLGWRIFLIRKEDQPRFAAIRTLEELKQLSVGQGAGWTDVDIYRQNGFKVVTGGSYEGLFGMLLRSRFDFFPRGVEEAPFEWDARRNQEPELHVEETLALHYPFVRYMWVANSPKGDILRQRLTRGLESMLADGTLDEFFQEYKGSALERASLESRTIFEIENPFLPETAPLERPEMWYAPVGP